ncbi:unnamed protein product [Ceratitis capitata]|uniref:(Mediterranean fruit fly) hypothetical protein n=3 Tax=Ceratitis capitata TaxID=7213 RepID=A0A811UC35_CERCA|nr:unnamed protein product [Ceratitis capitata]
MAFKFVAIFAIISLASAGVIPVQEVYHHSPVATAVVKAPIAYAAPAPTYAHVAPAPIAVHAHVQPALAKQDEEYDPHPQYKYGYDVQDALSGDSKSQTEERDGDVVHGEYSLIDADGFKRVVQYTADPVNGFNAVVNRVPLEHVKTVVKAAPVAYAAPAVVKQYPAPIAYHH